MNKLCSCGCGKEVINEKNRYLHGHNVKTLESKEKREHTCFKKYGYKSSNQSTEIKEKKKQTCLKNYGVEHPSQSKEVLKKQKQTCLKNYGTEWPMGSKEVKEKSKQSCLENYGVDNYSKTFEFRQFAREQMISYIESGLKDGQVFSPTKGRNEKNFISELQKYTKYHINNDSRIIGYFPDGYIAELNLVIELDEPWHERPCFKNHDQQKDKDYRRLNLKIFRVSEKEWEENQSNIIDQFKILVKEQSNE